jgi:hypothetical protein
MMRTTHRSRIAWAVVAAATVTLAGCVADDPDAEPVTTRATTTSPGRPTTTASDDPPTGTSVPRTAGFGRSRLTFFGDCPALLGYLQTESLQRVTAWGLGGFPYSWRGGMIDDMAVDAAMESTAGDGSFDAPAATVAPSYSGTNTQEVGVDEGDIVETNGTEIFIAGQDGVRIVDVAAARVIDTLELPQGTHQLLLDGDRLLVVTSSWSGVEDTIVSLFDVADPSRSSLIRRSHLEGRAVASRAIDGTARLVLTSSIAARLPFVFPDQFGLDEDRALEANQRIITESSIDDWMPRLFEENGDGSFGDMSASLECSTVAAPREFSGLGISWIATLDMRAGASPVGSAGIVSNSDVVYASTSNVYLATQSWDWFNPSPMMAAPAEQPPTLIHQFALGADGSSAWVASGEVPGRLLNQFSMGEHRGDLRVASTIDDWNGRGASESAVTVLRPQGGELAKVGQVTGLGPTEQIYAVRFMGDQAYVVTFRQTDPLYVIDLSDPTDPTVTGELKIPGYSAYLHPVGDGLLLGVGQNADQSGRTMGTQLSLFDVSDPANPQQLSTLPIGGYSDAEWDHHAFLYWPEDGTIVIPTSPWWGSCSAGMTCLADQMSGSGGGVIVAQLEGTQLVGRGVIQHSVEGYDGCWNPLQRSMIVGSEIVTVGSDQVQFTDRGSLVARDSVRWSTPTEYGCYYWVE